MPPLLSNSNECGMNEEPMHTVYLSLGTNLGDKEANLNKAIERISDSVGTVLRVSSFIQTEPWGFDSNNTFMNAAICVTTELSPEQLLDAIQHIERKLGRTHKSVNRVYHDRLIDIDILIYDDISIDTPTLTIPHPLMHERDFVMIPLREIIEDKLLKTFVNDKLL